MKKFRSRDEKDEKVRLLTKRKLRTVKNAFSECNLILLNFFFFFAIDSFKLTFYVLVLQKPNERKLNGNF